jgi:hypothetical protein
VRSEPTQTCATGHVPRRQGAEEPNRGMQCMRPDVRESPRNSRRARGSQQSRRQSGVLKSARATASDWRKRHSKCGIMPSHAHFWPGAFRTAASCQKSVAVLDISRGSFARIMQLFSGPERIETNPQGKSSSTQTELANRLAQRVSRSEYSTMARAVRAKPAPAPPIAPPAGKSAPVRLQPPGQLAGPAQRIGGSRPRPRRRDGRR